jgi:hypothetical protein
MTCAMKSRGLTRRLPRESFRARLCI